MGRAVRRQYLAVIIANLSFVIQGTSLGWPSPTVKKLRETAGFEANEIAWIVSLLYVGNFTSPIPSGWLMDKFGRKRMLVVLSVVPITSWLLVCFSMEPWAIYLSRFLGGLWAGTSATIIPMYQAEVSQPEVRGALSTFIQIMTYVGVCYEYVLGPYVSYTMLGVLNAIVPILFVSTLVWMPESPYWYCMKGRTEDAREALGWLRDGYSQAAVDEELELIDHSVKEQMKNKKTFTDLVRTAGNRRGLMIAECLAIFQRTSGISGVMAYTSITLPASFLEPDTCVIIMGVVWIVSCLGSTVLIDRVGRRPLLIASSLGGGISMALVAVWFFLRSFSSVDVMSIDWAPFAGLLLYGFFFSIGLGPIQSTVQGEMFPTNIKGIASAVTSMTLAVSSFIMNKIYLDVDLYIGMYFNFVIFSVACFICLVFVTFAVVETKGKTLQDIQDKLNSKKTGT